MSYGRYIQGAALALILLGGRAEAQAPKTRSEFPGLATSTDVQKNQERALAEIETLKRLTDLTNENAPERPDLLFRLAELYSSQERAYWQLVRDLDAKIADAESKHDDVRANQLKVQQQDFERRQKQWLLEAIKKYVEVAVGAKYQNYQRMDQVLFYLSQLLTEIKKEDQARVFFKRLIKDYPQSPFVAHAYLSFGEYFFEVKQFEDALKFYEKVLEYTGSPIYGYAMYKKGWVYYNLTDYKNALATFSQVIDAATTPGSKHGPADAQLAKAAKKDLVRTFAQIGVPQEAWPFFQRYGKESAPSMLEQLADLYRKQGKYAESDTLDQKLRELANSPRPAE